MEALPGELGYVENHMLAQEIFNRDVPVIPLYLRILVAAARADFEGLIMDPTAGTEMWNIEEFNFGD
jgi:peptide/nickel transport system substrate-binding protein